MFKYFERPFHCWFPKNMNKRIKKLDSIEVDVVSHCNLNCKSCTHFSPIASEWYINIADFRADVERTKWLILESKIGRFYILGGEPLLHPHISELLEITREIYQKIPVIIITNGFLLEKMDEVFWKTCEEKRIDIEITKYPVNFDYSIIENIIDKKKGKINITYKGRTRFSKKKQYKLPLDCSGSQDEIYGFKNCHMGGHCINLNNGHLYTCSYAAYIERFNSYSNKNIPITKEDSVDIYECQFTEEVIRKLTQPIPLCKYCNVKERTYGNEWGISRREISEWMV